MRVLICGGRHCEDAEFVHDELIRFNWRNPISVIIHGGLSGAGVAAEGWARRNGVAVARYPTNWEYFGKRAEKFRNDFMLADCRPDCVIAFPGGSSTADLVAKASAKGIKVLTRVNASAHRRAKQQSPDASADFSNTDRTIGQSTH